MEIRAAEKEREHGDKYTQDAQTAMTHVLVMLKELYAKTAEATALV